MYCIRGTLVKRGICIGSIHHFSLVIENKTEPWDYAAGAYQTPNMKKLCLLLQPHPSPDQHFLGSVEACPCISYIQILIRTEYMKEVTGICLSTTPDGSVHQDMTGLNKDPSTSLILKYASGWWSPPESMSKSIQGAKLWWFTGRASKPMFKVLATEEDAIACTTAVSRYSRTFATPSSRKFVCERLIGKMKRGGLKDHTFLIMEDPTAIHPTFL